jgi:hypothetical protein
VLDYSSLFVIQFVFRGVSLPRGCAGLSQGWLGEIHIMRGAHLFVLSTVSLTGLELVTAAMVAMAATKFSQCIICGEAFPGIGVQGVEGLILVGALFPLDGGGGVEKERRKKKRKKIAMMKEGFPRAGPTLLAV